MKRFIMRLSLALSLILGLLFAFPLAGSEAQRPRPGDSPPLEEPADRPEGQARIAVEVEQVRVDVTVQDRRGNLIQGLSKENFRIVEDRTPQEILNFTPIEAPITAVLITEYSKVLPWEWLYEAWLGSHIFLEQMRPDDWVAVVAYDIRPEILVDFTQNKFEAVNALRRLTYPAFTESNLYDTLADYLDRLQEVEDRTAIVLLSTGLDTLSKLNWDQTMDKVKNSNTVIYPVSLGGNLRARAEHRFGDIQRMSLLQADNVLRTIARFSGGQAFFPRFVQSYPDVFQSIAALLRHQYSLSYISTNQNRDGKFRKLKVEVVADIDGDGKPDRLSVNHREGYSVPKEGSN